MTDPFPVARQIVKVCYYSLLFKVLWSSFGTDSRIEVIVCIFADKAPVKLSPSVHLSLFHTYTHAARASTRSGSVSLCFNKSNHEAKLGSAWNNRPTGRRGVRKRVSTRQQDALSEERQSVKVAANASHNPHLCFLTGRSEF